MNSPTLAATRIEDWQQRRRYLGESRSIPNPRNLAHIKVLDYLIKRYRDSAEAHLSVRSPHQSDLNWNDRRIAVHRHLGRGQVAGVQSKEEAELRVRGLVHRMVSDKQSVDNEFIPSQLSHTPSLPHRVVPIWRSVQRRLKLGWRVDGQLQRALAVYPQLPRECVGHLFSRVADTTREDTTALYLFLQCENRNILDLAVRAWRERVACGQTSDPITQRLEIRIQDPDDRACAGEMIRERLADDEALVRIAAIELISKIGDLDDVGLLSDLLTLPQANDEDEHERDALAAAMKTIAESNVS